MPNTYTSLSSLFTAIANSLRSLKGTSAPIVADNFPSEISAITSKSAQTYTPTTADQTIAAGQYLSGAQTVKGDANLVAGNIKKDVTIFGVTGSHEGGAAGISRRCLRRIFMAVSTQCHGVTAVITARFRSPSQQMWRGRPSLCH